MKTCVICKKPVNEYREGAVVICQDCIDQFRKYLLSGEHVCCICGKKLPDTGHFRHTCCKEHSRLYHILWNRDRHKTHPRVYRRFSLTKYREQVNERQRNLDDTAARARANGISYGKQKAIDMGRYGGTT
ncbi:hypothetical protein ACG98G_00140 [Megasphaera hexanoica]|uniref:Uncharacterized protein n=1 Tax=Megasphaera hexanoica TaxID=1675036 RepID=A0ABW7DSE0_9FIRM|nr:hypothetical protein [Megasphaera hexanoica]AXB81769.1 hypothetical protein ACT01_05730 [Megasphaera hexanoica]